jgi:hypothetical protein
MVNVVVLVIFILGILSPYLSGRFGRRLAETERRRALETARAPARIMIPMDAYDKSLDPLLHIAVQMRGEQQADPLHLLGVVEKDLTADPRRTWCSSSAP